MATTDSSPKKAVAPKVPRRVRLSAETRRQQILDAALTEFSALGYEGATMDRIARRTGLTKAGVYAHFNSKEQILEALLVGRIFNHALLPHWQYTGGATLAETVDSYLEKVYRLVCDPQVQATFRLLVTESGRSPERAQRWSREILLPFSMQRQQAVDESVAHGLMPSSTLSRKFWFASAPALLALVASWFLDTEAARREVPEIRAWHREMMLTMLSERETP